MMFFSGKTLLHLEVQQREAQFQHNLHTVHIVCSMLLATAPPPPSAQANW